MRRDFNKLRIRGAMRRYGAESISGGGYVPPADKPSRNPMARPTKADLRAWGEQAIKAHRERQQRELAQRIADKHNAILKKPTEGV